MAKNNDQDKKPRSRTRSAIILFLNFILLLTIFTACVTAFYRLVIPTASEYDDPNTATQESFPWNPNIMSNFTGVVSLMEMGILRHVALFPENVSTIGLISLVGYVFLIMFVLSIREKVEHNEDFDIATYVQWGIGSIIGAMIFITGTINLESVSQIAVATITLSGACLILYLIHPKEGLFKALRAKTKDSDDKDKETPEEPK